MTEFVILSCPSCGAKLQITDEIDKFACNHCGNELVVKRGGGITFLKPVVDGISKVQKGVDKTASELAIKRLEKEISELKQKKNLKPVLEKLYESTKLGYMPRCKSVVGVYFWIEWTKKKEDLGFFERLSVEPRKPEDLLNFDFEELINLHDYFQEDQIGLYKKYDVYAVKPHPIEIKRFQHFRELLKPITVLKEEVNKKEEELSKHRDIVSS
jgi:DNA-directed RNA polymerase subunit RPC12/RpoP